VTHDKGAHLLTPPRGMVLADGRVRTRFRRAGAGWKITGMYFSTFFGGNDPTWATTKKEVAYFDKFIIWH
jgi:hypothetical protein